MEKLEGYRTIILQGLGVVFALLTVFGLNLDPQLQVQLLALVNGSIVPILSIILRFKTKGPVGG